MRVTLAVATGALLSLIDRQKDRLAETDRKTDRLADRRAETDRRTDRGTYTTH